MDQEIKVKWIEALRSGKYEQMMGGLRDVASEESTEYGYCCLGVLCDIVEPDGWVGQRHLECDGFPDGSVRARSGLDSIAMNHLSMMNDTYLQPFNEIADWIEERM